MLTRSSSLAALFVAVAGLSLAACASRRPAPVFSKDSPADPRAPAAPASVVERLGDPPASPAPDGPPAASESAPSHAGHGTPVTYTCPMHEQVKSERPGSCPVCGMSLVRRKAEEERP